MSRDFAVEPLGAHDRADFNCGASALDAYLRERSSQDVKRRMASCFVLVEKAMQTLAGFYTLSAFSVPVTDLPEEILKRLPRYPILPAALIGRLAIDRRFQRRGLASALVADAILRVIDSDIKAFAMIVDAKDDNTVVFYRRQGFQSFSSRPMSLFLPLATARKAASGIL